MDIVHEVRCAQDATVRRLAVLVALLVVFVYAIALARDHAPKWTRDAAYLLGHTTEEAYWLTLATTSRGGTYTRSQKHDRPRSTSRPTRDLDDYVLVWGFQALVNFLANRRAPTRYIFNYPLTFDRPESAFRVQARRMFLRDLRDRPPVYIVLVTNDVNPLQPVDSYALVAGFPEFQRLLQDYRLETDVGEFHLYRRIGA